jgi:hypothetical protein
MRPCPSDVSAARAAPAPRVEGQCPPRHRTSATRPASRATGYSRLPPGVQGATGRTRAMAGSRVRHSLGRQWRPGPARSDAVRRYLPYSGEYASSAGSGQAPLDTASCSIPGFDTHMRLPCCPGSSLCTRATDEGRMRSTGSTDDVGQSTGFAWRCVRDED